MSFNIYRIAPFVLALFALSSGHAAGLDFKLFDTQGVQHRLSDYRGKWVVVNYWATWCPPCLEEIPELEDFHTRHRDDVVVLGVNSEDIPVEKLREFVEEHFISYPVLLGGSSDETPFGLLSGRPTTFLISPAGEVAASHLGQVDGASIEEFIKSQPKAAKPHTASAGKSSGVN